MKKLLPVILKLAKVLGFLYAALAALLVTALLLHAGVEKVTGKPLHARAQAICAAALGGEGRLESARGEALAQKPAEGAEERKGEAAKEAKEPGRIALDLRRELIKTADEIRLWDGRVEILAKDVKEGLEKIISENEVLGNYREAWKGIRASIVPLLNQLLGSRPGWKPLTEEQFEALVVRRKEESKDGKVLKDGKEAQEEDALKFSDLLQELGHLNQKGQEQAAIEERLRTLQGLPAEVLAGLFASASQTGGENDSAAASAPPGDSLEVRFLMALRDTDGAKLAKIFKLIQEENPAKASSLFHEMLAAAGEAPRKGISEER
ncbi:MAG: hypothetical protein HY717_09725 [Planctomycetes bacterium]|nr:hypothetical protein [Planctomycetota bacterium]